jgi:integrase
MFQVLLELRQLEVNPARLVKNLSEKSGEREVYLSREHFEAMVTSMPEWLKPITLIGYYTGMRQGEILGLTRKHINLVRRIIVLGPEDVKEGHWKRIPVHDSLVSVLEAAMKVAWLSSDYVFVSKNRKRSPGRRQKGWAW